LSRQAVSDAEYKTCGKFLKKCNKYRKFNVFGFVKTISIPH